MVIDQSQKFHADFSGIKAKIINVPVGGRNYTAWIFRCGKFINYGSLDEETWLWKGLHNPNYCFRHVHDDTVVFINKWCGNREYENIKLCH